MKAISIKQPWASLIVHGIKNIENRSWKCPEKYIGQRILIHASGKPDKEPYMLFNDVQADVIYNCVMDVCASYHQLSAIIGSVEIVDCVINHPSIWAEKTKVDCTHPLKCGSYDTESCTDGCIHHLGFIKPTYNWVLDNPILFPTPMPAKGKLSFWDYPDIQAGMGEFGHEICMCQLSVAEEDQVMNLGGGDYRCRYCGGIWYK